MKHKFLNALVIALIMFQAVLPITALADDIVPDGDIVTSGNQSGPINLGTVAPGATLNPQVSFTLVCSTKQHVDQAQTVNLTASAQSVPAGGSLSATNAAIPSIPASWPDDTSGGGTTNCPSPAPAPLNDSGNSTVTITAPTAAATYTYVLRYFVGLSPAGNNDNQAVQGGDHVDITYTLTVSAPVNTAPTLSLPSDITAEATSAAGATVSYSASSVDAEDNPDPTPSCSPASGSTFPIATTTVNCLATDSGGMSASGSFTVTVRDTTAPVIAAHADVNAEATSGAGAVVSYTNPATSDAVDGSGTASCAPASGGTFALGSTTVTCNATDSHGNAAVATTFAVNVLDTQAPVLSLPTNISQEATGPSGNVVIYSASATDVVDGAVAVSCTPASGSTFPIAATTVNCSATDAHSNTANGSFSVIIADTTAPVIAAHDDVTEEATGPGGAIVNYTSPATSDVVDGAGVASCLPASGTQFALGDTTVSCNKSDAAGNAATPTTFKVHVVDTTPPTIAFVSRTAANGNGWNNGDVTVNWSCSDLVGVVSASVSETVSTEGANQSATGTCEDTSGNTADDTQSGINIDTTAPSAAASRAPLANSFGWNNTDVTVSFSGTDTLSGIDSCSANQVFGEGAGQSASGTCTDKAGNVSAPATVSNINVDKTAPTASASASPAPNSNGWNKTDVTVSFSGTDGLSGIDTCSAAAVLSSEGAGQSASGTCTDKAGNVSPSATASGINIDKTNPLVALVGGPANGGTYYFGFVPAAPTCSASDALSGIDGSCSVSGYGTTLGSHTVTANAADKAGNSASASASYTVSAWTLNGFYQPVDMGNILNTVKNGSTVPLKFEISAGSTELTDTANVKSISATQYTCTVGVPEDAIETLASTTGGSALRYDTTAGQFIFNWKTPSGNSVVGKCYRVTMETLDGSKLIAFFKLK